MPHARKILALAVFFACLQTAQAGWTKQNSGTLAWLRAVYFLDENRGWAAGGKGVFLVTEDGGRNWQPARRFTEDQIRDVYFADERTGWVLCERDVYSSGDLSASYLMRTADGGATWEKVDLSGAGKERIARVFFAKNGGGWAVGEGGAFFALRDDRRTWKREPLPVRYLMLGGSFPDDLRGVLVGGGGTVLFTEDGGMSWQPAAFTAKPETKLNSVFFANPKTGWTVGANGKIYATMNGGKFWREQDSTVARDLTDVFFVNTAEGWAIGDGGTILHTTTAGNVWTRGETGVRHRLERIYFVGKKGWAVGFGGSILRYEAGGAEKTSPSPAPQLQNRTSRAK